MSTKIRLLRFTSETCHFCAAQKRASTLEKFVQNHPETSIVELVCGDAEGKTPKGSSYASAFKLSDEYDVQSFPVVVFEAQLADGKSAFEVARAEGNVSLKDFEKIYTETLEDFEVSRTIPW